MEKLPADSLTDLISAIKDGDRGMVSGILKDAPDLSSKTDPDGYTPCFYAFRNKDAELVRLLLSYGSAPDAGGNYPMHYAALFGDDKVFSAVAGFRMDAEPLNGNGDTPLFLALLCGNACAARRLLGMGADPSRVNPLGQDYFMQCFQRGVIPAIPIFDIFHEAGLTLLRSDAEENRLIDYVMEIKADRGNRNALSAIKRHIRLAAASEQDDKGPFLDSDGTALPPLPL